MKVVLKEVELSDEARVVASVADDFEVAFDRCVEKIGGRGAWAMEDHGCPGYFTVCKRSGAVVGKFYVVE